jgi:uncharacterized membrane protein
MEITLKTFTLYATVALTGLSAGFFYAWSVSVIPGTQRVMDITYLESMQAINRAILNPAFFVIFFGPLLALSLSSIYGFHHGLTFWLMLSAAIFYFIGTFGVTALGNVPLNDQLDLLRLAELNSEKVASFREYYEKNWNKLHMIRTLFSVLSFLAALLAVFTYTQNNS